jgi:hypothetical protein
LGESEWEQLLEHHCFELQGVKHDFMRLDGTTTSIILMDQPRFKFKRSFKGLEEQDMPTIYLQIKWMMVSTIYIKGNKR